MEADCTSATRMGEVVSEVMSQAAATSFIHMQVLAATQVSQSMRNTGTESGARVDSEARCSAVGPGWAAVASSVVPGAVPALTLVGAGSGATLRVLSWDGNGGMHPYCATVGVAVLGQRQIADCRPVSSPSTPSHRIGGLSQCVVARPPGLPQQQPGHER